MILAESILGMQRLKDSKKMLKKFGQTQAKSVSTPADLNVRLQKKDGVRVPVDCWEPTLCCNHNSSRHPPSTGSCVEVLCKSYTKSLNCTKTDSQISERNCVSWLELQEMC